MWQEALATEVETPQSPSSPQVVHNFASQTSHTTNPQQYRIVLPNVCILRSRHFICGHWKGVCCARAPQSVGGFLT